MNNKTRINKFIFKDGSVFLRLKTVANKLKVKKNDFNYLMEFINFSTDENFSRVDVNWIDNLKAPEDLALDYSNIEHEATNNNQGADVKKMKTTEEFWGSRYTIKSSKNKSSYYYLQPNKQSYAVRVGPIPAAIDGSKLQIDWEKLQWGSN